MPQDSWNLLQSTTVRSRCPPPQEDRGKSYFRAVDPDTSIRSGLDYTRPHY